LSLTFGVVAFTIVVQGITLKPLIRLLGIGESCDDDYSRSRVRQVAIASAIAELEGIANKQLISRPVHQRLRNELDARLESANTAIDSILGDNQDRLSDEFRVARARISSAEKGAIEQAMNDGWVSANTASKLIEEVDHDLTNKAPAIESPAPPKNT
jgi:CPA1 family monovalent cation:H+ antiporter